VAAREEAAMGKDGSYRWRAAVGFAAAVDGPMSCRQACLGVRT
jgi:hypothetical protein